MAQQRTLGLATATSLVVANMVGSGIYTSLGFQLQGLHSLFAVLMLWVVGGIMALCGSLVYAELGAAFPHNGGEYNFLSKLYSPLVGFLAGWVSAFVGFAAPVAAVSLALGHYLHRATGGQLPALPLSMAVLVLLTVLHAWHTQAGARFQRLSTVVNVLLMLTLIGSSLALQQPQPVPLAPNRTDWQEILGNPAFATNLYWVSYAYTGWNAAAYIAGEIRQPQRLLPRALIIGTLLVMLLYVLLNYAFLRAAPTHALRGQLEVGYIAGGYLFGPGGARWMGLLIAMALLSTMSAMTFAGPRVMAQLGQQVPALLVLGRQNRYGAPTLAVCLQSGIAAVLIAINQFQLVIDLIGFTLAISTSMAVAGVFILRQRPNLQPSFKIWGYPLVPLLYLAGNAWILYYGLLLKWQASLGGLCIIAVGVLIWWLFGRRGTHGN
ncbi:MAG: amino acid permease [Chitinophagaceae bacterium]|jgi:APA family basic amino acid/polyamine antiporter|nr:amino acid permease [Chitinophagaceae bacterium]